MGKPVIIAGGGLVLNENGDLLMIFRRGKWDLPKGKLDPGESIEACALREVTEETGVQNLQIGPLLLVTTHQYFDAYLQEEVIKETHWFRMKVSQIPALIAQREEDIIEIEWTKMENIEGRLLDSYETIREVILKSDLIRA